MGIRSHIELRIAMCELSIATSQEGLKLLRSPKSIATVRKHIAATRRELRELNLDRDALIKGGR